MSWATIELWLGVPFPLFELESLLSATASVRKVGSARRLRCERGMNRSALPGVGAPSATVVSYALHTCFIPASHYASRCGLAMICRSHLVKAMKAPRASGGSRLLRLLLATSALMLALAAAVLTAAAPAATLPLAAQCPSGAEASAHVSGESPVGLTAQTPPAAISVECPRVEIGTAWRSYKPAASAVPSASSVAHAGSAASASHRVTSLCARPSRSGHSRRERASRAQRARACTAKHRSRAQVDSAASR